MINAVTQIHQKDIIHQNIAPGSFIISDNNNDFLYLGCFTRAGKVWKNVFRGNGLYTCDGLKKALDCAENNDDQNVIENNLIENNIQNDISSNSIKKNPVCFKNLDIFALACTIFELVTGEKFVKDEESFAPKTRWKNCDKSGFPKDLQIVLEEVFNDPCNANLSMKHFTSSDYYKHLEETYGSELG